MNRSTAATCGLAVPAAMALGMSANTSYRFLGTTLDITMQWERGLLCGVAEAAILALTTYSWATRTKGAAWLAYAIVLVQAVPAFEVSGTFGGVVRVLLGPVLLAVMLHLLLGLEVRMSGNRQDGILRAALRELRERLTAYLGIGRRGADSAAIARSRAADRAVTLADRLASARTGSRRYRRHAARLADAIDAARRGLDTPAADAAERAIVGRVVRRKSVATLATITERYDWTAAAVATPTATAIPAPRDTDRDSDTADRDSDDITVDTDRDNDTAPRDNDGDNGTADRDTRPAPTTTPTPPGVIDLLSKRQAATSRDNGSDLDGSGPSVAATLTGGSADLGGATPEGPASVAQIVRTLMSAGESDRDTIVSRVLQIRPDATRAAVARAMQRQANRDTATNQTGQYL